MELNSQLLLRLDSLREPKFGASSKIEFGKMKLKASFRIESYEDMVAEEWFRNINNKGHLIFFTSPLPVFY